MRHCVVQLWVVLFMNGTTANWMDDVSGYGAVAGRRVNVSLDTALLNGSSVDVAPTVGCRTGRLY